MHVAVCICIYICDTVTNVSLFLVISHSSISQCQQWTQHMTFSTNSTVHSNTEALHAPASIKPQGVDLFCVRHTKIPQNPLDQLNVCAKAKEGNGGLTCI